MDMQDQLPLCFFKTFQKLKHIKINGKKLFKIDNLKWFLKNLDYYEYLELIYVNFDESFYKDLSDTIKCLTIKNNLNLYLNYDFIFKFKNLEQFIVYDNVDLFELAMKSFSCFSKLYHLVGFTFFFNDQKVEIEKGINSDPNLFSIRINDELIIEKTNHEGLDYRRFIKLSYKFKEEYITDYDSAEENNV